MRARSAVLSVVALFAAPVSLTGCHDSEPAKDTLPSRVAPSSSVTPYAKPSPEVQAILAGLAVGNSLGPLTVRAIEFSPQKNVVVLVERGDLRAYLAIGRRDDKAAAPIASSEHYAFYTLSAPGSSPPQSDMEAALGILVARVKRTEGTVPVPSELGPVVRETQL